MSGMVEIVSKALESSFIEAVSEISGEAFEKTGVSLPGPQTWERYARAAIAAMREPTEGMVDAAYDYDNSGAQLSESYDVIYTVMIDAALKEAE